MGNNKIIGAKIKSIRESKQLSTQEVSERSGLSIEQIERIEGNKIGRASCRERV